PPPPPILKTKRQITISAGFFGGMVFFNKTRGGGIKAVNGVVDARNVKLFCAAGEILGLACPQAGFKITFIFF
ncbi:hypothetical protein ACVGWL_00075, partial [Enterobacter asburiae]